MFTRVCSLDDLWEGDMESFEVAGKEILVIHADGGDLYAVQGICPHQEIPLEQGTLRAKTLTCRAHLCKWDHVFSGLASAACVSLIRTNTPIDYRGQIRMRRKNKIS